jgi:hypothetical protein
VAKTESQYQTTPFLNEIISLSYGIVLLVLYGRHWLIIWDTMLDTFHMLFVALMTGKPLPGVNSSLESSTVEQRVAESIISVPERIPTYHLDHKLASRLI